MPKVRLAPQGLVLEAARKTNLLQLLLDNKVPIGNACGGHGLCASCKVQVCAGAQNLSRPSDIEAELCERNNLQTSERISCQTLILGDIEITTNYW